MTIKASDAQSFTKLLKDVARDESPGWLSLRTAEVIDVIRGELIVLEQQNESVKPDDDMILEALVRIAAVASVHAADNDLARLPGVMV